MLRHRFLPYFVLSAGVLIVAGSSILIRLAQTGGAPSLGIAAWRLTLAVLILTPLAWRQSGEELRHLSRRDIGWGIIAGMFLAAHMAAWISSLAFTSVASSAALVTTNPLWITLIALILFGEHPNRYTTIGLVAAMVGSSLIAFSDGGVLVLEMNVGNPVLYFNGQNLLSPAGKTDTAMLGDGLALLGAITVSGYMIIGRSLRRRLSTIAYVWLAYTAAMITLIVVAMLTGQSLFSYPPMVYLWLLLLAIGPQLVSHTIFNWALAHLSATFVALAILGEPIGSAILAYLIFSEKFAPVQLAGFVLLLVGIGLGAWGEQMARSLQRSA